MSVFPVFPFAVVAAMFLVVSYAYSRRTGYDLHSSLVRILLIAGKWFGVVLGSLGGFIAVLDLLYLNWWGGGDIGASPWVFVAFGAGAIGIGVALWKFFDARLRHDIRVGRI